MRSWSAGIMRWRFSVLHDPLVTHDPQITSTTSGTAAKRKQANEC